jgi:hypothetical protein
MTIKCIKCLLVCSHPYPIWAAFKLNFAIVLKNLDFRFQSFKVSNFMSVSILQNPLRHTVASGVQVNQHTKAYTIYTIMVWAVSHIRWLYGKQIMFHKLPPSPWSGIMMKTEMGLATLRYCCSAIWYSWQPKGVLLQTVSMKTSDCVLIPLLRPFQRTYPGLWLCVMFCKVPFVFKVNWC